MKIQPSICIDHGGKPRKNLSQVGRYRDSNPGPPECESRALPRSHLVRNLVYAIVCLFICLNYFCIKIDLLHFTNTLTKMSEARAWVIPIN